MIISSLEILSKKEGREIMAKATKVIDEKPVDPEQEHEKEIYHLESLLIDNKDTLKELLKVLDNLKEHEVFNMVNGGLGQSEDILYRITTALDSSNTPQSLKNSLLMFDLLGKLNMDELETVVLKINEGIKNITELEDVGRKQGYKAIIKSLKDPQVVEGLNVLITLTKALGTGQSDEKKVKNQRNTEDTSKDSTSLSERSKFLNGANWKALGIGMGIGALLLPVSMIFKEK